MASFVLHGSTLPWLARLEWLGVGKGDFGSKLVDRGVRTQATEDPAAPLNHLANPLVMHLTLDASKLLAMSSPPPIFADLDEHWAALVGSPIALGPSSRIHNSWQPSSPNTGHGWWQLISPEPNAPPTRLKFPPSPFYWLQRCLLSKLQILKSNIEISYETPFVPETTRPLASPGGVLYSHFGADESLERSTTYGKNGPQGNLLCGGLTHMMEAHGFYHQCTLGLPTVQEPYWRRFSSSTMKDDMGNHMEWHENSPDDRRRMRGFVCD
ncbi:hypothetical protein VNO77_03033 [Canavalia gladiata]|uniref:Uncharacterized protein n=1 Tax=Canavalia gladiata TaxID=3824 RepID=A0AAN9R3I0_CANGL